MDARQVEAVLTRAMPQSETWPTCRGEAYGSHHVDPYLDVTRVLTCVTPTAAVMAHAKMNGYDLVVAHHPFVSPGMPLMVFHTPLDMCPGGLNDLWRDALEIRNGRKYLDNLGWIGEVEPISFARLTEKVAAFSGDILGIRRAPADHRMVRIVCVCSGMGGFVEHQVRPLNPDVFVTGQLIQGHGFTGILETGHTRSEWIMVRFIRRLLEPHGVAVEAAPLHLDVFGREIA